MKIAHVLANLACGRVRLRQAISTARGCSDSEYVRDARADLENLDRRIEALVNDLHPDVITEAREITNAPI